MRRDGNTSRTKKVLPYKNTTQLIDDHHKHEPGMMQCRHHITSPINQTSDDDLIKVEGSRLASISLLNSDVLM